MCSCRSQKQIFPKPIQIQNAYCSFSVKPSVLWLNINLGICVCVFPPPPCSRLLRPRPTGNQLLVWHGQARTGPARALPLRGTSSGQTDGGREARGLFGDTGKLSGSCQLEPAAVSWNHKIFPLSNYHICCAPYEILKWNRFIVMFESLLYIRCDCGTNLYLTSKFCIFQFF